MRTVIGYGASFNRDRNQWVLYSMPNAVPIAVYADDRFACDSVLSALRASLKDAD